MDITSEALTLPGDEPATRARGKRLVAASAFALLTIGTTVLVGGRLSHTSWPLERAHMSLVGLATVLYFASFVFRALGWRKLFPSEHRPGRSRCLAACGAAAASGVVLPFRLDYAVKIATLRRLPGVRVGLEAIALSIISLGLVDAVAFLPLSISATAATSPGFRVPLILVVLFGLGACGVLVGSRHLARLPFVTKRAWLSKLAARAPNHSGTRRRDTVHAWLFLVGCWSTRAVGSMLLLAALGAGFSPGVTLVVLCLGAAAALIPITSGGAVANVGTTAAVLLALGVHREQAINFGLASGLLLCGSALAASMVGLVCAVAARRVPAFAR